MSPFNLLQSPQAGTLFLFESIPPRDLGYKWSTVRDKSSNGALQYAHTFKSIPLFVVATIIRVSLYLP
jgi:hypothetical protein